MGVDLPEFWQDGHFRLFISHIAEHREEASELQQALRTHYISAFVAHSDIEPTHEWIDDIIAALKSAEALIALLQEGFHESRWTDQEVGIAIGVGIPVISLSYDLNPYGFIGRYQALRTGEKDVETLAEEIATILVRHPKTRRRMAEATVTRFANSNSFENAKRNMTRLEKLEYWDPSLSDRALQALEENRQINHSWGVAERLTALIDERSDEIPF